MVSLVDRFSKTQTHAQNPSPKVIRSTVALGRHIPRQAQRVQCSMPHTATLSTIPALQPVMVYAAPSVAAVRCLLVFCCRITLSVILSTPFQ